MGASAIAISSRARAAAGPLRLLQGWHLLSLDAATVAFSWALLFSQCARTGHALPAACALACAVWMVYAGDRLLDARSNPSAAWQSAPQTALSRMYQEHAHRFLVAGVLVSLVTAVLLAALPRALVEAWSLLALPLALYATAVHVLHLTGRWKAVCVGLFFAAAAALPAAVHGVAGLPLLAAAVAFGGVCRANCAVLRASDRRLRGVLGVSAAAALLPLCFGETRAIALACLASLALLALLVRHRESICTWLGWLTWRALVDAALVAPALLFALGVAIVH